jgi:hypothetical protein
VKKVRRGRGNKAPQFEKRVDETLYLTKKRGGGILKEEVWYDGDQIVKYSLAYINQAVCEADNGRVLGYDNNHGKHHRHYMGKSEELEFTRYEDLVQRFQSEVEKLWRALHEEKR